MLGESRVVAARVYAERGDVGQKGNAGRAQRWSASESTLSAEVDQAARL
jgi:hypothetical protein